MAAADTTIQRATAALGAVAFLCVGSITVLSWGKRDVPDALAGIGGGAIGSLATLLTTYAPTGIVGGRRGGDPVPAIPAPEIATAPPGPPPLVVTP